MILSMTGFGRSEGVFEGKKITVDIKSLNSKSFDLNIKMPLRYKEKEFEIRKMLSDSILRGKVDCYINLETLDDSNDVNINHELVKSYIDELKKISGDGPDFEYLKMAIRMPEAISTRPDELNENEWFLLTGLLKDALSKFNNFRKTEGDNLHEELKRNIHNIETYLGMVAPYEGIRLDAIKEKYRSTLNEFDNIDETRFYQEMAYFTEKLDISEEKVRLTQHLKYYAEVMKNEDFNGKKLGFISQEIGREINTLGSKANHAEIQKLVVMMKDDLEKIKEQTLNVL
ncbi:MAG: YicC family protein [Weeksellaceae bacterium]|uniref:YicC/YloC family endoribonuclease n=1 Tax=Kaistella soli TaxID=2849654 RepID=UPI000B4AC5C6|nr:YicC/YloC family endoribonuclease [Kaistella soli]MBU4538653.1 YicC family protein [Bacteroidota bacterium]MBU8882723.1 YicC family protein [Kaistella soli]MCG2780983.1 YicC family protein [Weeksellaceae bacterium]OWK73505.1 YicC family protein [Flavobacteriaceae bacterium JJC]